MQVAGFFFFSFPGLTLIVGFAFLHQQSGGGFKSIALYFEVR